MFESILFNLFLSDLVTLFITFVTLLFFIIRILLSKISFNLVAIQGI